MSNDLKFYEGSLRIDRDNLDEEVANFPGLYYTVNDHYLEALKARKRREERLDRLFASLAYALRKAGLEERGSRGVTETQIKQEVLLHPKYKRMKAKLIDFIYVQDRWSALKDAYLQKSFSLKGLVSLAVSEQYQSPHSTKSGGRNRRR